MLDNDHIRSLTPGSSVSVTTSATLVVGHNKTRFTAYIQNTHASTAMRVGESATVTGGGGITVSAGGIYAHHGSGALYAIAASSTVVVGVMESIGTANIFDVPREGTVSVTSARTLLLAKDPKRSFAVIQNTDGSNAVAVGDAHTLMSGGGMTLAAGIAFPLLGSMEVWGIAGGTNEIQSLSIAGSPTGGTYTLAYGNYTSTLAYSANAAAIQAALEANPAIGTGNVTVTGTNPYTITFVGQLAAKNVAQIVADGTGLTPDVNEVQRITITGSPVGGTFTLTFTGQTTAAIPYNANASAVQSALEALSNIAPGDISVAGGALPGTPVDVTFIGTYAATNVTQMTEDHSGLTGGTTPAVGISTTTGGASPTAGVTTSTPGVSNTVVVAIRQDRRAA